MQPDNPSHILLELDSRLDHPVELTLIGKSAIWLGYDDPPEGFGSKARCGHRGAGRILPGHGCGRGLFLNDAVIPDDDEVWQELFQQAKAVVLDMNYQA